MNNKNGDKAPHLITISSEALLSSVAESLLCYWKAKQ